MQIFWLQFRLFLNGISYQAPFLKINKKSYEILWKIVELFFINC